MAHKVMPGNRPSNTLLDELSAASVGALIAMYEHKVSSGFFWDINPFDQWALSQVGTGQNILTAIHGGEAELDASTLNLLSMYKNQRKS